ncbi:YqzG/YhdC family protein [Ammoniphilus sp. 3BR4]|uniref:YqzG/YhdC family protein n=1 Tax=Ammoniphilus sp. 3BR4 TaxID=3158265 RepID=UPI0034673926
MKNLLIVVSITFSALFSSSVVQAQQPQCYIVYDVSPTHSKNTNQHEQEPPYAKWGRLALQETKKKYPQAEIIDYLHVGLKSLSPSTSQETFKLWLKEGIREFGVYVRIKFDTRTETVQSITFEETHR